MAMMGVVSGRLYRRTHSLSRPAWSGSVAAWRRSTFIKWLCHDDSTINIILSIIIVIIIIVAMLAVAATAASL